MKSFLCGLAVLFFSLDPTVHAAPIAIFNTGVGINGTKLPARATDPHWLVTSGPSVTLPFAPYVVNYGYGFSKPNSAWIWISADARGVRNQIYTFSLSIDLTGIDPNTVELTGAWGIDNFGEIYLNGSPANGSGALSLRSNVVGNFRSAHAFSIDDGFRNGLNTLEFKVVDSANPGALHVTSLTLSGEPESPRAVPEPATVLLIGFGLASIWWTFRRSGARKWRRQIAT